MKHRKRDCKPELGENDHRSLSNWFLLAAGSNVRVYHSFLIYGPDLETQNRQNSTDSISCKDIGLVRLRVRLGTMRLFGEADASIIGQNEY